MKFRGGEFPTGTTGNFQPELTKGKRLPLGKTKPLDCHRPSHGRSWATASPLVGELTVYFDGYVLITRPGSRLDSVGFPGLVM